MVQGVSLNSYAKFPPNRTVIFFVFDVFLGLVLICKLVSVDLCSCGIWGKLDTGFQGVPLNSYAKFPPNRTVIFFVFDVFLGRVLRC